MKSRCGGDVDMVVADEYTREIRLASWNTVEIAYLFFMSRLAKRTLLSLLWFCYRGTFVAPDSPRRFFR
jgi:hypothetical protein